MKRIPHPRIGYVGSLNMKVDFDWLQRLATERSWQIVLVGQDRLCGEDRARFDRLRESPNVHYLGSKRGRDIPACIRALDVGLMCYRRVPHMEVASPLKLFEYCAAGLPIVARNFPALTSDPEVRALLEWAETPEEAYERVRRILAEPRVHEEKRAARIEFARRNTWQVRAKTILSHVDGKLACRA